MSTPVPSHGTKAGKSDTNGPHASASDIPDKRPCSVSPPPNSELSNILGQMSHVLGSLAQETTEIQSHVAPIFERATDIDTVTLSDLQRLDRHAQYLVELARLTEGLSKSVEGKRISVPALCRLVRLPSLRNRFLGKPAEEEGGRVSLF